MARLRRELEETKTSTILELPASTYFSFVFVSLVNQDYSKHPYKPIFLVYILIIPIKHS